MRLSTSIAYPLCGQLLGPDGFWITACSRESGHKRYGGAYREICPPPAENSNALAVTAPAADGQGAGTLNAPPSKPSRKPTLSLPPKRPTPSNFDLFPESVPSPKTRKTFVLAPVLVALSPSRAVGIGGSLLPLSAV